MESLSKTICIMVFFIFNIPVYANYVNAPESFRYMSLVVRDQSPTVFESKVFYENKENFNKFLEEWLQSKEHDERLKRYFQDVFGVKEDVFIMHSDFLLEENHHGVLQSNAKDNDNDGKELNDGVDEDGDICSYENSTLITTAWWSKAGESVRICNNLRSLVVKSHNRSGDETRCYEVGSKNFSSRVCGCGPEQILCLPKKHYENYKSSIRHEFSDRAIFVVKNDKSWFDLMGGDFFYGNKLLYHHYLYLSKIKSHAVFDKSNLLTSNDIVRLKNLDLENSSYVSFPDVLPNKDSEVVSLHMEWAGLLTMPGFLKQNASIRSRSQEIVNSFLCSTIDSRLNIGGISEVVNPHVSDEFRRLSKTSGCAGCHVPMDNLATIFINWNDEGVYNYLNSKESIGHFLGETGIGPQFLAKTLVENEMFNECMVKKAWEGFSGTKIETLSEKERKVLKIFSLEGPKSLLENIFRSKSIQCIRGNNDSCSE